jgi:hypothetical protein
MHKAVESTKRELAGHPERQRPTRPCSILVRVEAYGTPVPLKPGRPGARRRSRGS